MFQIALLGGGLKSLGEHLLNRGAKIQRIFIFADYVPYLFVINHRVVIPPAREGTDVFQRPLNVGVILLLARDELRKISSRIEDRKVLGLDCIPNMTRKLAVKSIPNMLP